MPETPPFAERLGTLLREHRGKRTQTEVAATLGIADSTYSDYERGNITPSLAMLVTLLEVLAIDANEILALIVGDNDDEPNGTRVVAA